MENLIKPCLRCCLSLLKNTIYAVAIFVAKGKISDDSHQDQGSSSPPSTDEAEFSPFTGKLSLKGAHTGLKTHGLRSVKDYFGKVHTHSKAQSKW